MAPLIVFSLANVAFGLVCYRCFTRFYNVFCWHCIDFNSPFKGSYVRMMFILIFSVQYL